MCKFKKFLSVTLSLSIVFNLGLSTKAFADESEYWNKYCSERNSKGGYSNEYCANIEARKILLSGEKDYVIMENQGGLAQEDIYFFNFRALDKLFEVLDWDKKEFEVCRKNALLRKKLKSIFNKFTTAITTAMGGLFGFLIGDYWFKAAKVYEEKQKVQEEKKKKEALPEVSGSQENKVDKKSETGWSKFKTGTLKEALGLGKWGTRIVSSLYGSILSLIIFVLTYSFTSLMSYKGELDFLDINGEKDWLKERLIERITSNEWPFNERFYESDDVLKIVTHRYDGDFESYIHSSAIGLNYTDEEKNTFKQKFEKLAEDLKNNIKDRKDAHRKCYVLEYGEEKVAKWEKMIDEAIKQRNAEQKES